MLRKRSGAIIMMSKFYHNVPNKHGKKASVLSAIATGYLPKPDKLCSPSVAFSASLYCSR